MVDDQPFGMASGAGGSADPDASAPSVVPPWLLKAKVVAPEPAKGYLRRASLLQRLDGLLERRLTVLRAPAGFGKTTVLADVAHGAKEQGLVVAWISLDDDDTPNIFGSYLAAAFEHAGLDLTPLNAHDAWASSRRPCSRWGCWHAPSRHTRRHAWSCWTRSIGCRAARCS